MTKDDWLAFEYALTQPYGTAALLVDGFKVSFSVSRSGMRLVILTYVNGVFKGEWIVKDCEERRRFYRPSSVSVYSEKERQKLTKGFSKTNVKKYFPNLDRKFFVYHFEWLSVTYLKRHLMANNKSIEVLS